MNSLVQFAFFKTVFHLFLLVTNVNLISHHVFSGPELNVTIIDHFLHTYISLVTDGSTLELRLCLNCTKPLFVETPSKQNLTIQDGSSYFFVSISINRYTTLGQYTCHYNETTRSIFNLTYRLCDIQEKYQALNEPCSIDKRRLQICIVTEDFPNGTMCHALTDEICNSVHENQIEIFPTVCVGKTGFKSFCHALVFSQNNNMLPSVEVMVQGDCSENQLSLSDDIESNCRHLRFVLYSVHIYHQQSKQLCRYDETNNLSVQAYFGGDEFQLAFNDHISKFTQPVNSFFTNSPSLLIVEFIFYDHEEVLARSNQIYLSLHSTLHMHNRTKCAIDCYFQNKANYFIIEMITWNINGITINGTPIPQTVGSTVEITQQGVYECVGYVFFYGIYFGDLQNDYKNFTVRKDYYAPEYCVSKNVFPTEMKLDAVSTTIYKHLLIVIACIVATIVIAVIVFVLLQKRHKKQKMDYLIGAQSINFTAAETVTTTSTTKTTISPVNSKK